MLTSSRLSLELRLASIIIGVALSACAGSNEFGAVSVNGKKDESGAQSKDAENDQADQPSEVVGAFLACAFMDSENVVLASAKANPNGSVDVGCGMFRGHALAHMASVKVEYSIYTNEKKVVQPPKKDGRPRFDLVMAVPVRDLSGTVLVRLSNGQNPNVALFRKALWSVTAFEGGRGYDVIEDQIQQSSLQSGAEKSIDPTPSTPWWQQLVALVVTTLGQSAMTPASNDIDGSTAYTCSKCRGSTAVSSQDDQVADYVSWTPASVNNGSQSPAPTPDSGSGHQRRPHSQSPSPASVPAPSPAPSAAPNGNGSSSSSDAGSGSGSGSGSAAGSGSTSGAGSASGSASDSGSGASGSGSGSGSGS